MKFFRKKEEQPIAENPAMNAEMEAETKEETTEKKPKLSKKKKIGIAGSVAVVAILAVTCAVLFQNPLETKASEFKVEFGEAISTQASTYLKKSVDDSIVENTTVTFDENLVEGEEYNEVGEYTVTLTYENKEAEVTVIVEDTTAPTFNATATAGIETIEGVEIDLTQLITATDLSGAEVTLDTEGLDLDTAGSYTILATATDKYDNTAEQEVAVKVAEAPSNMTGSEVSVDKSTGKVTVSAKTYTANSNSSSSSSGSSSSGSSSGSSSSSSSSGSSSSSSSGTTSGKCGICGKASSSAVCSSCSAPTSGYIAGSGHTYESSGWEVWDGTW